uniref:Diphosphomevalonate decarboxylase n=1 Tax=Ganoderma boninense TaxID=34458 RepID=A0A5K1K3M7_9APHY|nr:Argininosuccinate lyase (ASAL) (EC (Arginosuccinase) [Ganoderma boninense]
MSVYQATASAPVNIACIKCVLVISCDLTRDFDIEPQVWGKRDTKLILPTNSSLSVTLDQDHLRSTTTARADPSFQKDRLWLNGSEDEIKDGGRLATCIKEMKALRKQLEDKDSSLPKISGYCVHISSRNNFPTAAGLASSASGFAALVASLAALYKLPTSQSDLSRIARQGSGSACRSLFGGFVAWQMGELPDGSDSLAVEVAPREHWPDIHALICVVNDEKKGTSSTTGMQRTVETSPLLQHRIKHVVPERMTAISEAIRARDFDAFARITMQDSNQFHAVALDTEPPIFYMNDVSRAIIALIVEYNRIAVEKTGKLKAAYTYDAGPNAVIYTPKENRAFKDPFGLFGAAGVQGKVVDGFNEAVSKPFGVGAVKGLIHTRVGDGPRTLGAEEALLGPDGLPK